MQGLRAQTPVVPLIAGSLTPEQPFRLIDMGGTGIQAPGWRDFGERLQILSVQNDGGPEPAPPARLARHPIASEDTWRPPIKERYADTRMFQMTDPPQPVADWLARPLDPPDAPLEPASGLQAMLDQEGFGEADFLKIDTGAQDFVNLRSLEAFLARPTLLGVSVRAILSGGVEPDANILANVDGLMRRHGFDLFTLEPVRYSSALLPFPFKNPTQGATFNGRPLYMRVVYLRPTDGLPPAGLLKAAAIRAMIDLPDQAAEVLTVGAARLPPGFDLAEAMTRLTRQVQENTGMTYADHAAYLAAFEARDPVFYDFRARHGQWLQGLMAYRQSAPQQIAELEERLAAAERRLSELTET